MTIIGIDPGMAGGIAWFTNNNVQAIKMPQTPADVYEALSDHVPSDAYSLFTHAYLEKVGPKPGQGIASTSKFMRGVGVIEGILTALRIPFEEVSPQKWQKALGCLTGGDKRISKKKAQQLFPHIKVTHNLADALLICEYGRRLKSVGTLKEEG